MKKIMLKIRDFLAFTEGAPKTGQVFCGMCVNDLKAADEL